MLYDAWKQKIRRFLRDDILVQSSFLNWKAWESDNLSKQQAIDKLYIEAYAPRVFAVSAATGAPRFRSAPEGTTILDLCRSVLEIRENVSDLQFIAEEKTKYVDACAQSQILARYHIDPDVIQFAAPASFLLRTLRAQWDSKSFSMRHIVRSWLIYQKLDRISAGSSEACVERLLRLSAVDAFRSSIALFSMIHGKDLNFAKAFISISTSNFEEGIRERFGIDADTVRLVASRLSLNLAELKAWHEQVLMVPEVYRKHYPLPFYTHPLLDASEIEAPFDVTARDSFYVCPCPYMMLAGSASFIFRLLAENEDIYRPRDIHVDLGHATEMYLADVLPQIFEANRITRINNPAIRNADFLIELDDVVLAVECKKTIGTRIGRTVIAPEDQVKVWEKLTDALEQCASTKQNLTGVSREKPFIPIIVADENILGEDGLFALVAETSGMLAQMGIERFEVLSIDQFERIFSTCDHAAVCETSIKKWDEFRLNRSLANFSSLARMNIKKAESGVAFPQLEEAFSQLFANLTNPFVVTD
jgi:hypothetical protein